jgi:hypothetical protein
VIKNEIGNTYGRLRVQKEAGSVSGKAVWVCACSCGNTKLVTGDCLRTGKVRSCGCYQDEFRKAGTNKTHGMSRSPTYRSWQEMKVRCYDPTSISFPNYGGRGISVCKRRRTSFEHFLIDMGVRPKGTSLDRENNNLNYSPRNCKWSARNEQNRNKRSNIVVRYKGESRCLSEWCDVLNVPYPRSYYRLVVKKWPAKKTFETPFVEHKDRKLGRK